MTVKKLIKELEKYDPDARVFFGLAPLKLLNGRIYNLGEDLDWKIKSREDIEEVLEDVYIELNVCNGDE